jgi:hypothetical protein
MSSKPTKGKGLIVNKYGKNTQSGQLSKKKNKQGFDELQSFD